MFRHSSDITSKLEGLLSEVNAFNAKAKAAEIAKILYKYIQNVEKMSAQVQKYSKVFGIMKTENAVLEAANETLTAELKESRQESVLKRMADLQLRRDYDVAVGLLKRIPRKYSRLMPLMIDVKEAKQTGGMRMYETDVWSGLADFLANMIEKYAEQMDLDALPDPRRISRLKAMEEMYRRYMRLSIQARQAA